MSTENSTILARGMERKPFTKKYEEHGYVLDHVQSRGVFAKGRQILREVPIVQLVGEDYFTLLEAVVKEGVSISIRERIYIGKDVREKIEFVKGRIKYEDLTSAAKAELPGVIEEIVRKHEAKFTEWFNKASAVTPKMHAFELLPGIGKKYTQQILKERERGVFKDFNDLQQRTGIPDPVKVIAKRILEEIQTEPKYRLFTRVF